ncbi:hypothetical protein V499_07622, partial [Pseudogymnoascus sp. VKM F-103]
ELVGAEIWETEAGRRQLRGEVDGVNESEVEAQQVKDEAEKDTPQPQEENTKEVTIQPENAAPAHTEGKVDAQKQAKEKAEKGIIPPQPSTTNDRTAQTLAGATAKLHLLGYDGASDDRPSSTRTSNTTSSTSASISSTSISSNSSTSTAIPPERMERLPSYVETDEGEPQVKLSREERAAILQITVLSSPVRGKEGGKGEGEGK